MNSVFVSDTDEVQVRLKATYAAIIKAVIPDLEEKYYEMPLDQVRVDSIDLITIRTELERMNEREIPDHDWINFDSLDDIINYCIRLKYRNSGNLTFSLSEGMPEQNQIVVNMPQMAIEALSESWLFKELGHRHWEMLCNGLNLDSHKIEDEAGNRLYATFVRIQIAGSSSLASFKENDKIEVNAKMERFGMGMYFSSIEFRSATCSLKSRLMTSFSLRNSDDNTRLTKSQPHTNENNIRAVNELPAFGNEYRNVKKGTQNQIDAGLEVFPITDAVLFETEYTINPYYDLNGVGLLYFAAYPIISDTCEARYFNALGEAGPRWEIRWSTRDRDIFYYGNCNVEDTIIYKLHSVEFLANHIVKTYSSLVRKKDGKMIAQVFSVKSARQY